MLINGVLPRKQNIKLLQNITRIMLKFSRAREVNYAIILKLQ